MEGPFGVAAVAAPTVGGAIRAAIMAGARDTAIRDYLLPGLDVLRVGIAVFDAADLLVYCNEHFRYIYRSLESIDELVGQSFADILRLVVDNGEIAGKGVLDDPEGWIAGRLATRRAKVPRPAVERLADGRWFEVKERPLPDGGVIGVWLDVTEQKRAHLRITDSLESAADGLVLWDQRDRLRLCNRLFLDLFGDGPQPEEGALFADVVRGLAEQALDQGGLGMDYLLETWTERHGGPTGSHVVRHRDGRWLLVRERRVRDGGAVTVLSDITELKNREQELILRGKGLEETVHELEMVQHKLEGQAAQAVELAEELDLANREVEASNRSKTSFLRIISHELRTPLNAIIGFADLLEKQSLGAIGNPAYVEYAGDIRASGFHLLSLVNQLLDLSRIDAGRYQIDPSLQDIDSVVQQALRIVGKQASDARLAVICDLPDDLPIVQLDEQAMRQILVNLVSNAIKFTPAGGEVRIEACRGGDSLVLSVRDNGIGIPAEVLPRLMRPFERNDNDLNRRIEGTGLGLAISKALVELHGGSLEIDSALGEGTTVTIRLPLALDQQLEAAS